MTDDLVVVLGHPGTVGVGGDEKSTEIGWEILGIAVELVDNLRNRDTLVEVGVDPGSHNHASPALMTTPLLVGSRPCMSAEDLYQENPPVGHTGGDAEPRARRLPPAPSRRH